MRHFTLFFLFFQMLLPVSARRIYVSTSGSFFADGASWETSINDLSAALSRCSIGDSVWVAAGTYYGGFYMPEGVTVLGGFLGTETAESQRCLPFFSTERSVLNGKQLYRVLEQPSDYVLATIWDGFVITEGVGLEGAGVKLRRNGILRNCLIQGNAAGMPAVGEYLPEEGGVVLTFNSSTRKGIVMSLTDYGRHYQHSRSKEVVVNCNDGSKSDWRLPSNSEMSNLTTSLGDGLYAYTPTFYALENTLRANGGKTLLGNRYWTSNTATESGNPVAYCFHTTNAQTGRLSVWGYCRVRPVRNITLAATAEGLGGGVYASDGSVLSGCSVVNNSATEDEDIHTEGNVIILDVDDDSRFYFLATHIQ